MNMNPLRLFSIVRRFSKFNAKRPLTRVQVRRTLNVENLEHRALLAIDAFGAYHNVQAPTDVNADGRTSALDALAIINDLNAHGSHRLAAVGAAAQSAGLPATTMTPAVASASSPAPLVDVNNDGMASPLDLLQVFNQLDAQAVDTVVKIRLAVTDLTGTEITSIATGQQFQLRAFVQDVRTGVADPNKGVFSAYTDVGYQSTLATPTGATAFDPAFDAARVSDTTTPGLLNEFGASRSSATKPGAAEQLLFTQTFDASQVGNLTFTAAPATDAGDSVSVYGQDPAVPPEQIQYGTVSLLIGEPNPTLSISDPDPIVEGDTGTKPLTFTVTLSAAPASTVTVNYTTVVGSALGGATASTPGADYVNQAGLLTFTPDGPLTQTITVDVIGDVVNEDTETFSVTLSNASHATIATATGTGTITDNDPAPTVSISGPSTIAEGNSGNTKVTFTLTLSAPSGRAVTVPYNTVNGTAIGGFDYEATTGTAIFNPGETSTTVGINVIGNTTHQPNRDFTVQFSAPNHGSITGQSSFPMTINDDDLAPVISIADPTPVVEGNSGITPVTFNVTLSNASSTPVTVNFATVAGTATEGTDYAANSGVLTFNPGDPLTKTVTVNVNGDTTPEPNETFSLQLSSPSGGTLATKTAGLATIQDDDLPSVSFTADPTPITEGSSGTQPLQFTVTLSNSSASPVTVQFSTVAGTATGGATAGSAGADFVTKTGTLTFNPGDPLSQTVTVDIIGDTDVETTENFTVTLSSPSGANLGAKATATGTILNDDLPTVGFTADPNPVVEGNTGTTPLVFTVTLSSVPTGTVTVDFATTPGSATSGADYVAKTGTLTFSSTGPLSQTVSVDVNGDTLVDGNETLSLVLSNPSGATLATKSTATGTIQDDDGAPTVGFAADPAPIAEGNSGVTPLTFIVTLSSPVTNVVTVPYTTQAGTAIEGLLATTPGADYVKNTGTVTFAANQTTQTITVNVIGDNTFESAENFTVVLGTPTGANLAAKNTATGTITDDDTQPLITVDDPDPVAEPASGTKQVLFTITLSNGSSTPVAVSYATQAGTAVEGGTASTPGADYVRAAGTLTFNPGDPLTKTVAVDVIGNGNSGGNRNFSLVLASPTGGALGTQSTGNAVIVDNQQLPAISISTPAGVNKGKSGTNNPINFTVTLSATSLAPVGVNFLTQDITAKAGTHYQAASGILTFAPGETSKTITVNTIGNDRFDNDRTFQLTLSGATGGTLATPSSIGTIVNDAPPPIVSINDSSPVNEGNSTVAGSADFTLTLSSASNIPVTVAVTTQDGTGLAGKDFNGKAGTVTFAPGETSKGFSVNFIGNSTYEHDKTFSVVLTSATGAVIGKTSGSGLILNDDAQPLLGITDPPSIIAGTSGTKILTFTVVLAGVTDEPVTVDYATVPGTATSGTQLPGGTVTPTDADYIGTLGTLTFAKGETTKTINVTILGNTRGGPDETFEVRLANPTIAMIAGSKGIAKGTIVQDQSARSFSIETPTAVNRGLQGTNNPINFLVTLSAASTVPITVNFATQNLTGVAGTDFQAAAGVLTFSAGETSKTITVNAIGTNSYDLDRTFQVVLSGASAASISQATAVGTILNDKAMPIVSVSDPTPIAEGASTDKQVLRFVAKLSGPSAVPVSVHLQTKDGTALNGADYIGGNLTVVFAPGTTTNNADVPIIGDSKFEADETMAIELSNPSGATLGQATATGTILNDDAAPLISIADPAAIVAGTTGTKNLTFTVTLSGSIDQPVTVNYSTIPLTAKSGTQIGGATTPADADFIQTAGTLTFKPGETSKTIQVLIVGNTRGGEDKTFQVQLSSPTPGAVTLAGGKSTATGTITEQRSSISGFVYHDASNVGVRDALEKGIAGVIITLFGTDSSNNPIPSVTTVTGADGSYSFNNLEAGVYRITETQPSTWVDGVDTLGQGGTAVTSGNDQFTIQVTPGDAAVNYDFGESAPTAGSISKKSFLGSTQP